MNIYYIRATIKYNTGVSLTIDQTLKYLLEEGMITQSEANTAKFSGYHHYSDVKHTSSNDSMATLEEILLHDQT